MNVQFGKVSTAQIQPGALLFDNKTLKEVVISQVQRETPSGSDHSGLFRMYVILNDGTHYEAVDIDEGEQVERFSRIG